MSRANNRSALSRPILTAVAVIGLTACGGGGAGESTGQFCDEAEERVGAFRDANGEVSPTIVGVLRELSLEAPDELSGNFETFSSASSDEDMDEALDEIETFLMEECGLDVRA